MECSVQREREVQNLVLFLLIDQTQKSACQTGIVQTELCPHTVINVWKKNFEITIIVLVCV